jgi:uncharacterized protein (DUF2461 family)
MLAKPPRGFDCDHRFIDDLKMKDYVTTIAFTEEQVCGQKFLRDFAAACRTMSPLVGSITRAFLLTLSPLQQVTLEPVAPQRPY